MDTFGSTCNGKIFLYEGDNDFLIVYIVLSGAVQLFLLYKMMRLCSIAFSYSNFHVHETYKLYALAIVNLMVIIFSRKTQLDIKQLQQDQQQDVTLLAKGYELVNDIFGILSIFTNNYMHVYNGFTWLLISRSCDYTTTRERTSIQDQLAVITEDNLLRSEKEIQRKRIYYLKNYFVNVLLLAMLVVSLFGTLNHKANDSWCSIVSVLVVSSSFLPLFIFGAAMFFYAGRFWDPQIPLVTKGGLVFLMVAMVIRVLYFLVSSLKYNDLTFGGDWLSLLYTLFCTLIPILVMSVLGEMQLKQQQYTLLRRSSLIFRSTVI